MKTITRLDVTNDVALVTLGKVPSGTDAIDRIFSALTRAEINVDMISQSALTGPYVSLSFTASGNDIGKIMEITARIREKYPTVKPLVSNNNVKLSLFGESMPEHHGIAAGVFRSSPPRSSTFRCSSAMRWRKTASQPSKMPTNCKFFVNIKLPACICRQFMVY